MTEPKQQLKVLVSACLLGNKVRYDGNDSMVSHQRLLQWYRQGRLITLCPEVAGGLSVPRPKSNIQGPDSGKGVLAGRARIINSQGIDVTKPYVAGAKKALAMAVAHDIKVAILKENSPSCGSHFVYDDKGSEKILGMGSTAAYLSQHGISVFSENEIDEALNLAEKLT